MARGLTFVAVLSLTAAACADDPTLDHESLVAGVAAAVVPDDPDVVVDVECPRPDDASVARSLTCTAAIHGEPIAIDLVVDEEGVVAASVREPLLDLAEVASALVERLEADLAVGDDPVAPVVVCPGTVVVERPGVRFDCTGESGGAARALVVTVGEGGGWTVAFAAGGG